MAINNNETKPYKLLPPDDTTVWRYLSLAKLLAMLKNKSIYFSRTDFFDDPFEGSFTKGSLIDDADGGGYSMGHSYYCAKHMPFHSFVSCWHSSEVESIALWKIYAKEEGGVAIKSTIGDLKRSFHPFVIKLITK